MRRPCRKRCGARRHDVLTGVSRVSSSTVRPVVVQHLNLFSKRMEGAPSQSFATIQTVHTCHTCSNPWLRRSSVGLGARRPPCARSMASGGAARGQRESSSSPLLHHAGSAGVCTSWMSSNPHILHSPKRACIDVYAPSFSGLDSQPRPTLASSGRRGGERRRTERASRVPP